MEKSTQQNRPAIAIAESFLAAGIENGIWKGMRRLPNLAELGRLAGVSRSSMWIAVRTFSRSGELTVIPRGGITLSDGTQSAAEGPVKLWEKKAALLAQDLLSGTVAAAGVLPRARELRLRYGVSHPTLVKILSYLEQNGFITPYGRTWRTGPAHGQLYRMPIVLCAEAAIAPAMGIFSQRLRELARNLEQECGGRNLSLRFVNYSVQNPNMRIQLADDIGKQGNEAGFIIDLWRPDVAGDRRRVADMVEHLSKTGKPVAILDERGDYTPPDTIARSSIVRIFRIAGVSAGRAVAEHLLALGHTCAMYASLDAQTGWTRQRFAGARQAFMVAGYGQNISMHTGETMPWSYEVAAAASGFDQETLERTWGVAMPKDRIGMLLDRIEQVRKSSIWKSVDKKQVARLRKMQDPLRYASEQKLEPEFIAALRHTVFSYAANEIADQLLLPFFNDLMAKTKCSAIICENDNLARGLVRYLHRGKIKVPQSVSVAGFDNMPESFDESITTVDFNLGGVVRQMLHFILHNKPGRIKQAGVVECEGTVVARGSTGKFIQA